LINWGLKGIVLLRIIVYNLLMHIRNRSIFLAIIMILVSTLAYRGSTAQSEPDSLTFEETGYKVEGEFLEKFQSAATPLLVYGYPITNAFVAPDHSPSAGMLIQYFQRARFELHPGNPLGDKVVVSLLGEKIFFELEQLDSEPVTAASNPACRFFAETGHQTCYAFLKFFDANGGVEQFGYPISEIITLNGQLVQYFEKARFEWHPERASGKRVTLTNLGQIFLNLYNEYDPSKDAEVGEDNIVNNVMDLKVRAFPKAAVIPANGTQTIYVIVTDQKDQPIPNAQITLTLTSSGEQPRYLAMLGTDLKGVTSVDIPLKEMKIGIVEILVTVNYGSNLQKETVTSFRVWY
jgi:hypothetical protein